MAQYIDKAAVVAEIERRLWLLVPKVTFYQQRVELEKLLSFIDTIEVKEVDLEKDVKNWIENNQDAAGFYDNIEFAKHFFELGMATIKNDNNNEEKK